MRFCTLLTFLMMTGPLFAADFAQPRPGLHTGGRPTTEQLQRLADQGVGTVIDLRHPDELADDTVAKDAAARGLRYVNLPIAGTEGLTPDNAERLRDLLDAADGEVLLHCASGNRVGALLALMAAQEEGMSNSDALQLGRRAGLKSLEPEVERRLRANPRSR